MLKKSLHRYVTLNMYECGIQQCLFFTKIFQTINVTKKVMQIVLINVLSGTESKKIVN